MTDTDLANQLQKVEHRQQLSEASTAQTLKTIESSLQSLQVDQRDVVRELKAISALSGSVDQLRERLGTVDQRMLEQSNRIETWFSEYETRTNERFNKWEVDRDRWRTAHESDNRIGFEQTETRRVELDGKVTALRENQRYAAGWLKGLAVVGGLLIGAVVLIFNDRFQGVQNGFADVRVTGQRNRDSIETLRAGQHEIELYLARGGERRSEPYVPPKPESNNAK